MTSALALVPGPARSPARCRNEWGTFVIHLSDARVHARHGHGELCPAWSRRLHRLITTFVASVEAAPFDQRAADHFGTVATALARRGAPIGTLDTLMAAHALSLDLTFVTNNTQHRYANRVELPRTLSSDTWEKLTSKSWRAILPVLPGTASSPFLLP